MWVGVCGGVGGCGYVCVCVDVEGVWGCGVVCVDVGVGVCVGVYA